MKKRNKLIFGLGVGCLMFLYISGPIIAGSLQTGNLLGPRIYPRDFHHILYVIGHESVHNIKPRIPLDTILYDRPWFYGQNRIPKLAEERQAVLERLRQNQSPMLELMIERNKEIEQGEQLVGGKASRPTP